MSNVSSAQAQALLKWVQSPDLRRQMFIHLNQRAPENLQVLEDLRQARHTVSQLIGFDSYAHMVINASSTLASSPEEVWHVLTDLAREIRPAALAELQLCQETKARVEKTDPSPIQAWDIPYYMGMIKAEKYRLDARSLRSLFTLGRCMEGLNTLCRKLFDLELVEERATAAREPLWHPSVQKFHVVHIKGGRRRLVGTMYLDLFPRADKYTHAAHFTIQVGSLVIISGWNEY